MKIAVLTTDNREHYRDYSPPAPHFGTAPEALFQGFEKIPEAEIHIVSCTKEPTVSPEKLANNIWFHGLHVPKMGWLKTGYSGCIRSVRKKLDEVQPDIVHGQGTERDCAISAIFSGFPSVLTVHGNMRLIAKVNHAKLFSFFWISSQLEKFVLPRAKGVVCITRYTEAAVKPLARKTWLLPNAVDESFFGVNATPDDTRTILFVGVISYRKNQNNYIRALDSLAAKMKFKLIFLGVAGNEDYGKEFRALVAERSWCEYGGFANREKLRTYFKTASMVALPSLEDNCPMVVLEAMAAGVPVLVANVGGVPDLVQDGLNGLFCDPLNAKSVGNGTEKLLSDRELAARLVATANKNAHERYHPLVIASKHLEIYREVLGSPK